jgi:hypothetical protein
VYYRTNLLHLIRFGFRLLGLKVQDFLDALTRENMVVAANAFGKAKALQQDA